VARSKLVQAFGQTGSIRYPQRVDHIDHASRVLRHLYFAPIALYQGWLMVGYATAYTVAPVFSLVLDRDVNEDLSLLYPELTMI